MRIFHVGRGIQNFARWAHPQVHNGCGTVRRVPNAQFGNGDCRENKFKKVCGKSNFHIFFILSTFKPFPAVFVVFKYKIMKNLIFSEIVVTHFFVLDNGLKVSCGFPRKFLIETGPSQGHSHESVEKWNRAISPSSSKSKIWCAKTRYFIRFDGSKI